MKQYSFLLWLVLCLAMTAPAAHAGQVWNYASDWSIGSNPNGPWTYGYQVPSTGGCTPYTTSGTAPSGLEYWIMPDETVGGNAIKNPLASGIWSGTTYLPAGEAFMHPGQVNNSIVRWIAPRAMWISIAGYFREEAGGDCDTHVMKNGASLADGVVSGFYGAPPSYSDRTGNPEFTFSSIVQVAAGDTIDFVLGIGPDGSWGFGTTALRAVITDMQDSLGTLTGHVRLDATGAPAIYGANVAIPQVSLSTATDQTGLYTIQVPAGTYSVKASRGSLVPQILSATVTAGGTTTQDFSIALGTGATYYVKPTGDDAEDGLSLDSAWKSIDNGDKLMLLNPGDRVQVEAGTYTPTATEGFLLSRCFGIAGKPITYEADGRAIVDRLNAAGDNRGITVTGALAHDIVLDGFEVTRCPTGIGVLSSTNVTLQNCLIRNLYPKNGTGTCTGVYASNATGCVVLGNTITSFSPGASASAWGIKFEAGGSVRADRNLIYGLGNSSSFSRCTCVSTQNVVAAIRNNTLSGSGSGFVQSSCSTQLTNNIITGMTVCGVNKTDSTGTLTSTYNLYYNNALDRKGYASAGTGETNADPMFVNASGGNYTVQSGSTAIDTGTNVGLPYSGAAPDKGAFEFIPPFSTAKLGDLRSQPEGTPITITSPKVVTAASTTFIDGSYYIEEPDRVCGIRVMPNASSPSTVEGDRVTLTGTMAVSNEGERVIENATVTSKVAGGSLNPLGMGNATLLDTIGVDRTGLLVRTWGWVTYRSADGSVIYVDDGSVRQTTGGKTGVMVSLGELVTPIGSVPALGEYVAVTGLAGMSREGSTPVRTVQPRKSTDLNQFEATGFDRSLAREWFKTHLGSNASQTPFSFTYNGMQSSVLIPTWTHTCNVVELDGVRTETTHTYTNPSGLQVRCVGVEYADFPSIEWTVYFKNNGATTTQMLENIQGLDVPLQRGETGEFTLHHYVGSPCQANDYQPIDTVMGPNDALTIAAGGGRSTNSNLCYFNIEWPGQGLIVALGWPGQWSARFARDASDGMRVVAGQELTHLRLLPGEEIRTPLVALQFWTGTAVDSQNVWRRWMLAHNMPRTNGELIPPQFGGCWGNLQPNAVEETSAISAYYADGIEFDYYDLDAGWYIDYGSWPNTGTWEVDYSRFPNGVREVSDLLHANGTKFILWFEPERVAGGTWLTLTHPEWVLGGGGGGVLNLGDPTAWDWVVDRIDSLIISEGVDWYRSDYNIDPLGYWRGSDASDRQGITENLYVQGFLAFWDELLRRHPNLWIDTCASGGRRNDLETLRRAVPLLRSDYWGGSQAGAIGEQCHTYGISNWMPCNGTGGALDSIYLQRSCYNPLHRIAYNPLDPGRNKTLFMKAWNETKQIMPYWYGDYYPLTPYSLASDVWMAWQFDSPEKGGGFVQAFRRDTSTTTSMQLKLGGLDAQSSYAVKNLETGGVQTYSGDVLTNTGLTVSLPSAPGSAIFTYTRVN